MAGSDVADPSLGDEPSRTIQLPCRDVSELFNPQLCPLTNRELVISQDEIARLCGLARQNTNRALHKLKEAGLLRIRYGVIEVLDLEGLQNYSREP